MLEGLRHVLVPNVMHHKRLDNHVILRPARAAADQRPTGHDHETSHNPAEATEDRTQHKISQSHPCVGCSRSSILPATDDKHGNAAMGASRPPRTLKRSD